MASVASASATQIPSSIRRDLLLCGLNKLEDKDTLKTAVDELHVIIQAPRHLSHFSQKNVSSCLALGIRCSGGLVAGLLFVPSGAWPEELC